MMASLEPIRTSACPLDCPDACSLDVTVSEGRVVALTGNYRNPVTAGYICGKVRKFDQVLYGPLRVREPALRDGPKGSGRFRTVSWDEALKVVVAQIERVRAQHGAEAILPCNYGGSNGYLTQLSVDARFFNRLGASRLVRALCAAPTTTALLGVYGKMPGVAYEDYAESKLIVVWGANPSATGIHLLPFIRRAQRQGAKLVVIDPRATSLARQADLHLAIRPGRDLPLALAVHRWLFAHGRHDAAFLAQHASGVDEFQRRVAPWTLERAAEATGILPDKIEQLAQWYSETSPAVLRCGWGVERSAQGGAAVAAILALPAVAGKFGERGGGFTMSNSAAWNIDPAKVANAPESPKTRQINLNRVGDALLNAKPPIGLLFVFNCNPLATLPAQAKVRAGLEREDLFTVVHEQVMTDTARFADVLLPATTFLEHHELKKGYGATVLQQIEPVVAPIGSAWPNYRLFAELCRRMQLEQPGDLTDPMDLIQALAATEADGHTLVDQLASDQMARPSCGPQPVQFVDVFPRTTDGKIHLVPTQLDAALEGSLYNVQASWDDAQYPLTLISPASADSITSTLTQLQESPAAVELHASDAAARGIASGEAVRIFNSSGEVICTARVTHAIRAGVASLPKGLWSMHTSNGWTSNVLVPDTLSDLGDGACFNDTRVEIERLTR
jgi:anaerobic selenocysteine-containing dehydrogenase